MEILHLNGKNPGHFIEVSPDEALRIIMSLSRQLSERHCNNATEMRDEALEYFCIAVDFSVEAVEQRIKIDLFQQIHELNVEYDRVRAKCRELRARAEKTEALNANPDATGSE